MPEPTPTDFRGKSSAKLGNHIMIKRLEDREAGMMILQKVIRILRQQNGGSPGERNLRFCRNRLIDLIEKLEKRFFV